MCYGGEDGPDLDEVAALAGHVGRRASSSGTPASTTACSCSASCRGLPTWAPSTERSRRRGERRHVPRVPAGSVGIAGRQTGVYPFESPGGWQLIGRTSSRMFDAGRGRRRRSVRRAIVCGSSRDARGPADGAAAPRRRTSHRCDEPAARGRLRRTSPSSVPGCSRPSRTRALGSSGRVACRCRGDGRPRRPASANALVGNDRDAAASKSRSSGRSCGSSTDVTFAVCRRRSRRDARRPAVPLNTVVPWPRRCGAAVRRAPRSGGRVRTWRSAGGIDVPVVLGSRATHTRSAMGGLDGRALRAGDRLALGTTRPRRRRTRDAQSPSTSRQPAGSRSRLRVLPGPQDDYFPTTPRSRCCSARAFTVHPQSDRMGYRLAGRRRFPGVASTR